MKYKEIRWIVGYLNRYPLMFFLTIIGSVIEITLYASPNLIIGKLIDLFVNNAPNTEILDWIKYLLLLVIIQAIVFYIVATINEVHAHRVTTDMTSDLFKILQNRPQYYHDNVRIGDVMARATGDTRIINIGISPAVRILIQVATLLVIALSLFIAINWKLAMILVITFPIYAFFVYVYAKKLGPESINLREAFGDLAINAHETFRGINEIKSYVSEEATVETFAEISTRHSKHVRRFGMLSAFYPPELIIAISLGLTVIYGIYLISINDLLLSEFVVFVGIITLIQFMSRRVRRIANMTVRMIASAKRLQEMMDTKTTHLSFGKLRFETIREGIEFKDVSFKYSEDREWALKDINLEINQGETVAIVGGPGSGKSTFIKLLLRLYDPQKGSVLIDGREIGEYSSNSLREQISAIEQDVFLFSESIRENIAFGKPDASLEEVENSAKLAKVHEFISTYAEGYDTMVGERGITLSGGQKQRIAIARALLMDPLILIMDDASSALDAETESQIQEAIKNILKTRTSVIITHRLALISEASKVIVFEKGEIVAIGPHQKILRTSTHYRRLFESSYELPPMEELL